MARGRHGAWLARIVAAATAAATSACDAPIIELAQADAATDGADATADGMEPIDPAFVESAKGFCRFVEKCTPIEMIADWGDMERCVERRARLEAHRNSGWGVLATPEQYRACAAALDVDDCGLATRLRFTSERPPACRVRGTLPLGANCGSSWQCESMHCSGTCGTCVAPAAEGAACVSDSYCAIGLGCFDRRCVRPAVLDEPCDGATPCALDLACREGRCVRASTLGEPCVPDADRPCALARNLRCDPISLRCTNLAVSALGGECGFGAGVPTLCAFGLSCRTPIVGQLGKCVASLPDGVACGGAYALAGGACVFPADCARGTCREVELADCATPVVPP